MNTVVFAVENEKEILDHFNQMEKHSPPFLFIIVYNNALHFDSRWIPPIRSLDEIAEHFDVRYKIDYRVPYEDRGSYTYTCLQQRPLSPQADLLRALINAVANPKDLAEREMHLTRHILAQSLNLHELKVLSYITGKRYSEFQTDQFLDRNEDTRRRGR